MIQRVCVVGLGAVGGWMAARLADAGCEVRAVARGQTLEAIRREGLRLTDGVRTTVAKIHVTEDPAVLGQQDLVIVAVKSTALAEAARRIGPLLGEHTVVLPAMNGVPWWFLQGLCGPYANLQLQSTDADQDIERSIPLQNVVGCVVHASCSVSEPGRVTHHFGQRVVIGDPSGGISSRVRNVASLLERAGFDTVISDRIQRDVWYKLWGNMTVNPISALTGATTDLILDDELVRGFMSSVMLEAKEVGARLGLAIDQTPEDRHDVTRKLGAFKTSMLQDVEGHRPIELDAIVGAVKELGLLTSVQTPFIDALLGLSRLRGRVLRLY